MAYVIKIESAASLWVATIDFNQPFGSTVWDSRGGSPAYGFGGGVEAFNEDAFLDWEGEVNSCSGNDIGNRVTVTLDTDGDEEDNITCWPSDLQVTVRLLLPRSLDWPRTFPDLSECL